MKDDRQIADE